VSETFKSYQGTPLPFLKDFIRINRYHNWIALGKKKKSTPLGDTIFGLKRAGRYSEITSLLFCNLTSLQCKEYSKPAFMKSRVTSGNSGL
jgi:hypothetical protein